MTTLTVDEIVGKLTKAEVIACLPMGWILAKDRRNWKCLKDVVGLLSDDMKKSIYEAACTKARLLNEERSARKKRKRLDYDWARRIRRRVNDDGEQSISEEDDDEFLVETTEDEMKECFRKFRSATSNDSLRVEQCVVCAREIACEEGKKSNLLHDLNVREILRARDDCAAYDTWRGALVMKECIGHLEAGEMVWICSECEVSLVKKKLPRLALANDLWIGQVPCELEALTIPEQLMIARHYPRCYVFKLYPREAAHLEVEQMQRGMKGNVSLFDVNTKEVVRMLEGQKMPNLTSTLASVVVVTVIGSKTLPKNWLKSTFRIRRKRVYEALLWLKKNNRLYDDICIDDERLRTLPEDGIPHEIIASIHQEFDEGVADRESEGFMNQDMTEGDDGYNEGDVIPLQFLGVEDVDVSKLSAKELFLHALTNLKNGDEQAEGGYAIRHGNPPVFDLPIAIEHRQSAAFSNKYDLFAAAYPILWPYGKGRWDVIGRREKLSYSEYVRWALQYYDRRFRTHHTFPFLAFGIQQKATALCSAKLQMRRRDFQRDEMSLSRIRIEDLRCAEAEEGAHHVVSNEDVKALERHVYAVGGRVMGSKNSRSGYRSQIWSMSLKLGPPSLWITINPLDYDDPIAQVFSGERIDMDHFIATAGPGSVERGTNIANDPYAAAKYFHFIINVTLETLMGIEKTKCHLKSSMGVLGMLRGYFGFVEAQGRGSLHTHMLAWLADVPNADEMVMLLRNENFRKRIVGYLKANIHADVDGLDEKYVEETSRRTGISYSRPIDPDEGGWKERFADTEKELARTYQVHVCKTTTCLRRNRQGNMVCKRRAPWPLEEETTVDPNGMVHIARHYGFLNGYNPGLLVGNRCNIDTKFNTNGEETKDAVWYCTSYASKDPEKSYNQSALLAKGYLYHQAHALQDEVDTSTLREQNRMLVYRCFNALNQQNELSGPQVMSYLMGWGDVFRSHRFTPVYWSQVAQVLRQEYSELRNRPAAQVVPRKKVMVRQWHCQWQEDEDVITFASDKDGYLYTTSQVEDYRLRGDAFGDMNFLDFTVETYEILKNSRGDITMSDDVEENSRHQRGRKRNIRTCYLEGHRKHYTHERIRRSDGHTYMPNVIGHWFPRRDVEEDEDFYFASILAFLRPWRNIGELKEEDKTWKEEGLNFLKTATAAQRDVIAGMQYYYDSKGAAQHRNEETDVDMLDDTTNATLLVDTEEDIEDERKDGPPLTEDEICQYEELQKFTREYVHGMLAVEAGRLKKILPEESEGWRCDIDDAVRIATDDDSLKLQRWKAELGKLLDQEISSDGESFNSHEGYHDEGTVLPIQELLGSHLMPSKSEHLQEAIDVADITCLNHEQRRAYDIVDRHLLKTLAGENPSQLRMIILGEGGTGKSRVIQAITSNFENLGVGNILVKGAYTGIAASIIDGRTLHVLTAIPLKGTRSAKTMKKLSNFWNPKRYLIIDEVSMLSRQFLAKLSKIITTVFGCNDTGDSNLPFGGLNVVLVGDFHQFPPVVSGRSAPLYYPNNPHFDNTDAILGRELYEQFTTVVRLRKQIRVEDPVWADLLQHVRYGTCKKAHIDILRSLIITSDDCPETNYDEEPWKSTVLITPRHAVRRLWNSAAAKKACFSNKKRLLMSPAVDLIEGKPLSLAQRFALLTKAGEKKDGGEERAGLMKTVELSIGMPVMVTANVHTELDIANGSRGEVVGIVLDPLEDEGNDDDCVWKLTRPPSYVLVRLSRTKIEHLSDLSPHVVPISPVTKSFTINVGGTNKTVTRTQLPMTSAYAFTDYRAEGQTITPAIVDIGRPPTGSLTPFNVYVALSRAKGRDSIRLLRDFDERLLQRHPNEYLRIEDERLKRLDEDTEREWQILRQL